jgi:hypothetical protein
MVHCRLSSLLSPLFFLLPLLSRTLADEQPSFDCHVTASGAEFDLTKLDTVYIVNRTRDMPPTKMIDSLRFNLCADLKPLEDIKDEDQVRIDNYSTLHPGLNVAPSVVKMLVRV